MAFATQTAFVFFDTANFGALPSLVGKEKLTAAYSKLYGRTTVVELVVPGVTGLLVAIVAPAALLAVNALTAVGLALLLRAITSSMANPRRVQGAGEVDDLRAEIGPGVTTFVADLSSLEDVRRAAKAIDAHYDRIDVLINNAGIHAFSERVTVDGFPEMTAVNYLAPWVLTNALRDKLIASAARVVTVASEASRQVKSLDPASALTSAAHYGRSKLMDIMFSQELARRMAGVTAHCCDPGFNTTGLGRELPFAGILEKALRGLRIGDPRRGAAIITRLATDPAFADVTGGYFSVKDAAPLRCPEPGRSAEVQRLLWDETEKALASM